MKWSRRSDVYVDMMLMPTFTQDPSAPFVLAVATWLGGRVWSKAMLLGVNQKLILVLYTLLGVASNRRVQVFQAVLE